MKAAGILQKTPIEDDVRKVIEKATWLLDNASKVDKLNHKGASEALIKEIRSLQTDLDNLTRAVRRKQWDIDKAADDAKAANRDGEAVHNEVNY